MVVLAVLAAGVHTMSIATPALAEQERLSRTAAAEAERAVVPNPAAADGMPVPALLGGIVLAFAVGLSAGQIQRRRRAVQRSAAANERPAPALTPSLPARPAPPPPEPVVSEPKPVEIAAAAAPPAPPPPAPVRSHGPRILRFRAAPPPPPEPVVDETAQPTAHEILDEPVPEVVEPAAPEVVEDEVIGPAAPDVVEDEVIEPPAPEDEVIEAQAPDVVEDEVIEALTDGVGAEPTGPLEVAPELPQRDERPPAPASPAAPLSSAPEALGRPESEPVVPARRFARARPWPKEAETLWTCEIAWKAGYLKSTFRAMAGPPGATRRKSIGESPSLRWTLMTDPEPPTPEMIASVKALVSVLVAAGWERTGTGAAWYAQRFVWRGSGEPRAVAVPGEIETAQ
ncbi:MAG: hypothetical protein ABW065_04920 [Solirubrobacterales bacterium]